MVCSLSQPVTRCSHQALGDNEACLRSQQLLHRLALRQLILTDYARGPWTSGRHPAARCMVPCDIYGACRRLAFSTVESCCYKPSTHVCCSVCSVKPSAGWQLLPLLLDCRFAQQNHVHIATVDSLSELEKLATGCPCLKCMLRVNCGTSDATNNLFVL